MSTSHPSSFSYSDSIAAEEAILTTTATATTMGSKSQAEVPSKTPSQLQHMAGYQAPLTGIFRILPSTFVPYAELMRLDRPAGFYAFYWHYAIGLAFAACISVEPPETTALISHAIYLAIWVVLYRGATCTWNDNIDQDLDRKVARCRNRPIARGAVSTFQGHVFAAVQTLICTIMLAPYPPSVLVYAALMTGLLAVYPFGKRITDFPQVILGFAFAVPVFMCTAAVDQNALPWVGSAIDSRPNLWAALCLYSANMLWTIIFDTVYAHQDIQDDIKAGVKSLAVRLGDRTKLSLGILSAIQVQLLLTVGLLCELSWLFFLIGCGGAGASLFAMLALVNLKNPASCAWWFGPGSRLVGGSVVLGLLGHYALRLV